MNQQGLSRMNSLFEKMLSGAASNAEQKELKQLYHQYINFGRDGSQLADHSHGKWHQSNVHH